jgi:ribulose-bisphosphate carboxylase large chain
MSGSTFENVTKQRFSVIYQVIPRDAGSIEAEADDITIEQTVEVPKDCIPHDHFSEGIVGKVERIDKSADDDSAFLVTISYRLDITGFTIPHFLNVVFGNISLKKNIRVVGFQFPPEIAGIFPGPVHGINGIRRIAGVWERPLACVALKPMGLSVDDLAAMAGSFARAGVDCIKDDHGIGDQAFHPFCERVARCQEVIASANAASGRNTLYFPMVWGRFDDIERQVRQAVREGVRGILIAPVLSGFDTIRHIAETYGLIIMAHPSFGGSWVLQRESGMTPAVLYGTIFRLIGCDVSIFPNAGGRFSFSENECRELSTALRQPLLSYNPALPCPAGGMTFERIPDMARIFGPDTMLLIGGALMRYSRDREVGTRSFMDRIRQHFGERLEKPAAAPVSSCEWPAGDGTNGIPESGIYRFKDFRWSDIGPTAYKADASLPFQGITRQEFIGPADAKTQFDLRYFEIEPGGYSSLEKHVHEHVIIGVRGRGVLIRSGEEMSLNVNDIAYVKPSQPHQLRNAGAEKFGFYCIVDRQRDRPQAVG